MKITKKRFNELVEIAVVEAAQNILNEIDDATTQKIQQAVQQATELDPTEQAQYASAFAEIYKALGLDDNRAEQLAQQSVAAGQAAQRRAEQ